MAMIAAIGSLQRKRDTSQQEDIMCEVQALDNGSGSTQHAINLRGWDDADQCPESSFGGLHLPVCQTEAKQACDKLNHTGQRHCSFEPDSRFTSRSPSTGEVLELEALESQCKAGIKAYKAFIADRIWTPISFTLN